MKTNSSIKKAILVAVIFIISGVAAFAYHEFNRSLPSVADLKAQSVTAEDLFNNFSDNEQQANELYLNKALQIAGVVLDVKINQDQQAQIVLDAGDPLFGINCTIDNLSKKVKAGDKVVVKGICTGYITDVLLNRSLIVN